MTESTRTFIPSPVRSHLSFIVLSLAFLPLFWKTLRDLVTLSLSADAYSFILIVPVISGLFFYLERRRMLGVARALRPTVLVPLAFVALALYCLWALNVIKPPAEYALSVRVAWFLIVVVALFALSYGVPAVHAASFPLLFLLLLVPLPSGLMDRIIALLQWGSAQVVYSMFRLADVPVVRTGVTFELPVVSIEVARECSSIHSVCALFIVGILTGHLFLRSLSAKILITLLTVPIAMFTNAVRITGLWFLATKVNIGFLYGRLHHNGGALFSLISLVVLITCLWLLRRIEGNLSIRSVRATAL